MSLPQCRSAIAKVLRTQVKGVSIQEHGGPLTLDGIKILGPRMPVALVACLGIEQIEVQGGVIAAHTVFAAYCIAQDAVKAKRDVGALLVAEAVLAEVPTQRWEGAASKAPTNVTGSNLYSTKLADTGFAMWVVRWRQLVDLERNALAELVPFETFFAEYDIGQTADTVTTTDQTELDQ